MIEFTSASDHRGRQDRRIEYREPVKIADSPFDVAIQDVYLSGAPVRLYLSGNAIFSGMYLARDRHDELVFPYTAAYDRMFFLGRDIELQNILMIGGAAYTYPRHCLKERPEIRFTVVDADPCAPEIARQYFFLEDYLEDLGADADDRLRLVTADGREYLDRCGERYDAILNDAFVGAVPVASLTTREAARRIRSCLTKNGLYLTNILASVTGSAGRFLRAEVKTLREVFRYVTVFPTEPGADPSRLANWMVAACDSPLNAPNAVEVRAGREDPVLTDGKIPRSVLHAAAGAL